MLNQWLDAAIAGAVTMYARESQRARLDEVKERGNERVGFLFHELRNLVNTAILAFEVLKTGQAGLAASNGAVLDRSLMGLRDLIARSLDEVRLTRAVNRTRILVSEFIDEVAAAARLAANARGIALVVRSVHDELAIEADRQILAAVVGNLLQNAFKFTRPHTTVTVSATASADRVIIDVQDECGGLQGAMDGKRSPPRSISKVPTGPGWASDSRSADGAPKQTMAGSMRATDPVVAHGGAGHVVASAPYGDFQVVVAGETHGRDHVGGPDAPGDQTWVPVDGTVPDCTGDVVVGVVGTDEPASEPVDLHDGCLLATVTDFRGCRCRHHVLLFSMATSDHRGPRP